MHKIIIVDDESLIRKRLIYGFNWESMGYEIVGEAANSNEAIELIDKVAPDVAVIDISMPNINGLELIKILRKKGNHIKIIILTGYSKFEYAKDALASQVYSYVLKPLDEDEFVKLLQQLSAQINEEKLKKQYLLGIESQVTNMSYLIREKFFHDLLTSPKLNENNINIKNKLKEFGIDTVNEHCIALLQIEKFETYEGGGEVWSIHSQRERFLYNILSDQIKYKVIIDTYDNAMILVIDLSSESMVSVGIINLIDLFNAVRNYLESALKSPVYIGIGSAYSGLTGLWSSYHEALYALKNRIIFKEKYVIDYEFIKPYIHKKYTFNLGILNNLLFSLEAGDLSKSITILDVVFDEIINQRVLYKEIQKIALQIINKLSLFAEESGFEIDEVMGEYADVDTLLKEADTLNEIHDWFANVLESLIDRRRSLLVKGGSNIELAKEVRKFILAHYSDPQLSLEEIASSLFITATYISSIFKKVNGLSVMQFITKVRLEKAKELLLGKEIDIRTVAMQSGYNDEYYFSRCFKKFFGMSPSNYIKIRSVDDVNN